jgi:hypothetical protein
VEPRKEEEEEEEEYNRHIYNLDTRVEKKTDSQ